jgi:hypothetical protein
MIFWDRKEIFLHFPRTGGTSYESAILEPMGFKGSRGAETYELRSAPVASKHLDAMRAEALWPDQFHDPEWKVTTIMRRPDKVMISQFIQSHNTADPNRGTFKIPEFRGWAKRRGFRYITAAEVDDHARHLIADQENLISAGASIARFYQTREPVRIEVLDFENLPKEIHERLGTRPPHRGKRSAKRKNPRKVYGDLHQPFIQEFSLDFLLWETGIRNGFIVSPT